MKCKEFRKRPDGEPGHRESEAFAAHASSCPECARILDDERLADRALGLLRQAAGAEQASPAAELRLLAELRRARDSREPEARRRAPRAAWHWLAAAAAVAVAAGLMVWRVSIPGPGHGAPGRPADTATSAPATALPPSPAAPAEEARAGSRRTQEASAAPRAARTETAAAPRRRIRPAEGTEFFATMPLTADEPLTDLQLVRVPVSERTLEQFGWMLDPREAGRPVKADLLIGPDGLTRAVRFISERK